MAWVFFIVAFALTLFLLRSYPLVLAILCVTIAGVAFYIEYDSRAVVRVPADASASRQQRPASAEKPVRPTDLTQQQEGWTIIYRTDPASGRPYARAASVTSDDEQCSLTVELPSEGKRYTDIKCRQLDFKPYQDLEIKFDYLPGSRSMNLSSHGAGRGTFIPAQQMSHAGHLSYDDFVGHLKTASAVALTIKSFGGRWVRFSLQGAPGALSALGKPKPGGN